MTKHSEAFEQLFHEEPAVWLRYGAYEAAVLPGVGANLIAFRDREQGFSLLREPLAEEMAEFKARPFVHGIPVLFPPNRYEDGKFEWNGRTYTFPVNEEATGNHLHGFVHSEQWEVTDYGALKSESYVVLTLTVREGHAVYEYLPHEFTLTLRYSLSEQGLLQQITVRNDGREAMPCMIAFHTTINAPFDPNSSSKDCSFKMTIGNRWELSERMLPTGQFQPLKEQEQGMKDAGISPYWESMDNHYTVEPQNGRNAMELTDNRTGTTLVYDAGTAYKQWMIWNNGGTPGFFCPEPQLNLVNAPNVDLPADEIGLVGLEPGGIWEETSRLYVRAAVTK
ncbi:aldose 1-epimerase [Paenibacillus sp. GCM10023252]|uniref:aldose 1-epimerase n=1 Tax=Paenibacillus sp. GCM10023252 TaxID=3252649 RepID=UPI00361F5BE8